MYFEALSSSPAVNMAAPSITMIGNFDHSFMIDYPINIACATKGRASS